MGVEFATKMAGDGELLGSLEWYTSEMEILLIGEGDFSFASSLASAFKSAPNLVATSLDSLGTLKQKYPVAFEANLAALQRAGAEVMHGVDVATMAQDKRLCGRQFDCIVFNFPHAGFVAGWSEDTPQLIEKHRGLLRRFFEGASKLIAEDGEIHVTHHVRWPYTEWGMSEEAQRSGLVHVGTRPFDARAYPGYVNRRGAGAHWGRSFPCHNAATFIFTPRARHSSRRHHHNV